ncbi:hypothetical protein [Saccharospirillum impatiens]|uniref:hypothetical protein n=1 Tax=Saccharospirillum impatiens TaxID=169438 RepID=UPI00048BF410|nr:hypothetical protein [Saccharospirillum impatiens]
MGSTIKHMILHIAKYSSKIVVSNAEGDVTGVTRSLVDSFIISVASLNILNTSLSTYIIDELGLDAKDLNGVGAAFKEPIAHSAPIAIAKETAALCKAIESTDHFEIYTKNSREVILSAYKNIAQIALAELTNLDFLDIESEIEDRLYNVEQKNIHFQFLGNYRDGYNCFGAGIN